VDNERSQREKAIAAMSMGLLVVAVLVLIVGGAGTIATKGCFETALKEMTDHELPVITDFFVSTPVIGYVVFLLH
jgi:cell division protein FtsN